MIPRGFSKKPQLVIANKKSQEAAMSNETLIRCCAPTMARLKTGNMFSCAFADRKEMTEELKGLNQRLRHKGLRILPLRWRDGKALLYLYRPKLLDRDLRDPLAKWLLAECGMKAATPIAALRG